MPKRANRQPSALSDARLIIRALRCGAAAFEPTGELRYAGMRCSFTDATNVLDHLGRPNVAYLCEQYERSSGIKPMENGDAD